MRRIFLVLLIATIVSAATASVASANYWGKDSLTSTGGTPYLLGTLVTSNVTSISPDSVSCIAYSSVVSDWSIGGQLQVGQARCGTSATIDMTCSLSNNFVYFVERIPHGSSTATCYPHGAAAYTGVLLSVTNPSDNGNWTAYINGSPYEAQSGYTHSVTLSAWGEYAGNFCTPGWAGNDNFQNWSRYNSGSWFTNGSDGTGSASCWFLGAKDASGNFNVNH